MRIGIDASRALRTIKTGTEYYSEQIIFHLAQIDRHNEYILYAKSNPLPPLNQLPSNFHWKIMPFPRGWTLIRLSYEMAKNPPDVLFIPAHTLPLITPQKSLVMVHDIGFIHLPQLYPWRQKIYHRFVINFVKKYATHLLTPSLYVKQDLIQTLKINPQRITAIHHGYNQQLYRKTSSCPSYISRFIPYIFYLGRLEKKKNLSNLIKAYYLLRKQLPYKIHLVLGGKRSHGFSELEEIINTNNQYQKEIVFPGYLEEKEVPLWLSCASLFVFPSQNEGFGFPVIEAQATECPVVCSDCTALPEIGGKGALYFNPQDPQDIAQKMLKVLTEPQLKKELIKNGKENLKRFSWTEAAKKTLKVLESI